jgi:ERCC4-type nuclease
MTLATILRDNREQKPYEFRVQPVDTRDVTLLTGDYTIVDLCDHDDKNDTYLPSFAVERKTGPDFLNSITHQRERFKDEIKRATEWEHPLEVVIEETYTTFTQNLGFMKRRKVSPNQVTGTVDVWSDCYNVNFYFAGNRRNGERHTFEKLMEWLRGTVIE